MLYLDELRNR